ncbi:hypothetical protein NIES4071_05760 [Calothrix sp. NIES-4071]|nr:hypothetical protein NIES4071_05760 [Calothrix sp. NIES-4071]BAZ54921.1 hypothetical protein NIES4105_05750 [Calothrix sp. NIES-4105]
MHDFITLSLDFENLDTKAYRIFELESRAEILHWFSNKNVPPEEKEEFIQALTSFGDKCGNFYYYRAYLFAAEALVYFPECRMGDEIVEQVLKWSYAYFRTLKQDWTIFPQPLVEAARQVIPLTDKQRVISAYTKLVHNTESRSVLRAAAKHLALLNPGNPTAIAALVLLLKYSPNQDTLFYLIRDLEEVGSGNKAVITSLIDLMQTTLNKNVCIRTIEALGKIANGNLKAIAALMEFLVRNQGDNICIYAVESLAAIDPDNPAIIKTLLNIVDSHRTVNTILQASDFIAKISPGNKEASAILLERIAVASDRCTLWNITECLVKIDLENQAVLPVLLNKLRTAQTEEFRYLFAVSIIKFQPDNTEAVNTLLDILVNSDNEGFKHEAATALIQSEPENMQAPAFLDPIYAESQIAWSRLQKAERLVQISEYRQRGIALLFKIADLLGYGYDEYNYLPAISILETIDVTKRLAIQALEKVIVAKSDTQEYALRKLAELEPENKLVIEKVKDVIQSVIQVAQNCESNDSEKFKDLLLVKHNHYLFWQKHMHSNPSMWERILQSHDLKQLVVAIKQYLREEVWEKEFELYDIAYNLIWECTQNMTYSDFYQAWHGELMYINQHDTCSNQSNLNGIPVPCCENIA